MIQESTLYKLAHIINENFQSLNNRFTEVYQAAEAINSLFNQMLYTEIKDDIGNLWYRAAKMLIFGSYQSWVNAYVMTAAGLYDVGLMSLRRSIEFVCYLSKIKNSDIRAEIWIDQINDLEKRKKFSQMFKIPQDYFGEKYYHLRFLLVTYDMSSTYGSHANFEMFSTKRVKGMQTREILLNFLDNKEIVPHTLGHIMLAGYRILEGIFTEFDKHLHNSEGFLNLYEALQDMVRKARISLAKLYYTENQLRDVIDGILEDDKTEMEKKYLELKNQYNKKNQHPNTPIESVVNLSKSIRALKEKGVIRSNSLIGDLGEWYIEQLYGATKAKKQTEKGWDLKLPNSDTRLRVKTQSFDKRNRWDYLDTDISLFDRLILVILNDNFKIKLLYDISSKDLQSLLKYDKENRAIYYWDDLLFWLKSPSKLAGFEKIKDLIEVEN